MLEHVKPSDLAKLPEPAADGTIVPLMVPELTTVFAEQAAFRRGDQRRHRGALLGAGALHLALFVIMAASWNPEPIGSGGQSLDAISVEISLLPAEGLSTVRPEPAIADMPPPPEPAAAATPAPSPPPEKTTDQVMDEPPVRPLPPPTIVAKPDPAPTDPEAPALDIREAAKVEPPLRDEPVVAPKPEDTAHVAKADAAASAAAATARPQASVPAAAARPSPGAIQAYARSIVAALDQSRPKAAPGLVRGTAKIAFMIAASGTVGEAYVAKSSGHASIDNAALAAVRRTSFKPPPPGLTDRERTFEVPYHFR